MSLCVDIFSNGTKYIKLLVSGGPVYLLTDLKSEHPELVCFVTFKLHRRRASNTAFVNFRTDEAVFGQSRLRASSSDPRLRE